MIETNLSRKIFNFILVVSLTISSVTSFSRSSICSRMNTRIFSIFRNQQGYSQSLHIQKYFISNLRLFSSKDTTKMDIIDNHDPETKADINVTLETASNAKVLKVQDGEILRTALLRQGVSPHNGKARLINCRGLGTCGTCAVEILSGSDSDKNPIEPKERNTRENLRLNFPPHGSASQSPHLRLACQVQVRDDIIVRKRTGFWGQDSDDLADEYEAQLWFGDLEYILDNKSPSKERNDS